MIREFQGRYRFLSNFWFCRIEYNGKIYRSVEHAYQAAKFEGNPEIQEEIRNTEMPGKAKRLAKKYKHLVRPDWEQVNLKIMEDLVRQKFTKFPALKKMLLETGVEHIQEGNKWHDTFYGVDLDTGCGENHLGKIIMKIREELK